MGRWTPRTYQQIVFSKPAIVVCPKIHMALHNSKYCTQQTPELKLLNSRFLHDKGAVFFEIWTTGKTMVEAVDRRNSPPASDVFQE